jgi:hypothetical protein
VNPSKDHEISYDEVIVAKVLSGEMKALEILEGEVKMAKILEATHYTASGASLGKTMTEPNEKLSREALDSGPGESALCEELVECPIAESLLEAVKAMGACPEKTTPPRLRVWSTQPMSQEERWALARGKLCPRAFVSTRSLMNQWNQSAKLPKCQDER